MAAICSAASKGAPQRAVEALKSLMADPNNEALHRYLFESLDELEGAPMANMSPPDREHMISGILNYNPVDSDTAWARSLAIAKTLRKVDPLSSAPIDELLYNRGINLPHDDAKSLVLSEAAQRSPSECGTRSQHPKNNWRCARPSLWKRRGFLNAPILLPAFWA